MYSEYGTIEATVERTRENRGYYLGLPRQLYLVTITNRTLQTLLFQYFLAPLKPASNLNGTGSTINFRGYEETGLYNF